MRVKHLASGWHVGIFEAEPVSGKCTWANNTLCNLFGIPFHEMVDYGWLKAIDRNQRIDVLTSWQNAVAKDIPYEWEYTVFNQKSSEKISCRVFTHTLRDLDGKPLMYYGTVEVVDSRPHSSRE